MRLLLTLSSLVFATCASTHIKRQNLNPDRIIFESPLHAFSGSTGFRMMPSINCNSSGMADLIRVLQNTDEDTLIVTCYSGYLGTDKDNLKKASETAKYIKGCIDSTFTDRFVVKSVGLGKDAVYTLIKDTILSGINFKAGDSITKATYSNLQREDIMYFESKIRRIEVYSNSKP